MEIERLRGGEIERFSGGEVEIERLRGGEVEIEGSGDEKVKGEVDGGTVVAKHEVLVLRWLAGSSVLL